MSYVYIAIASWLLLGIVALMEKNLVDKGMQNPNVLAFFSGFFAIFLFLIFLPSARITSGSHVAFDLLCGIIFFGGVWAYFTALKHGDVTEILTLTGAFTPIFSIAITHYALKISFSHQEVLAFILLIAGIILISYRKVRSSRVILFATISAILMALYYSLVKNAYTPFSANFAFVRLGSFIAGMFLLFNVHTREEVFGFFGKKKFSPVKISTDLVFVGKEIIAGVSFITLNYAISIGNGAVVNALQGTEYAFVFIVAAIFTMFWPGVIKEDISKPTLLRKCFAVLLIFIGILILNY